MSAVTRLVRSFPGGDRIHLATCRYAKPESTVPWKWAEGKHDDEWLKFRDLKPCRVCLRNQSDRQRAAREVSS